MLLVLTIFRGDNATVDERNDDQFSPRRAVSLDQRTVRTQIRGNLKQRVETRFPGLFFRLLVLRSYASVPARATLIKRYLKAASRPRLQLGSGRHYLAGWLNTDYLAKHPRFIYLNVCHRFPLPTGVFERVYSEHMIEHLSLRDGENMLAESFRVLKPGGRIRVETPDLERTCNLYAPRQREEAQRYLEWHYTECGDKSYPPTVCFAINNAMRNWGHRFLYDREMLGLVVARAGFRDVQSYPQNETQDPEFQHLSHRANVPSVQYETLAIEATKPL